MSGARGNNRFCLGYGRGDYSTERFHALTLLWKVLKFKLGPEDFAAFVRYKLLILVVVLQFRLDRTIIEKPLVEALTL